MRKTFGKKGEFTMKSINGLSNIQKVRLISLFIISVLLFIWACEYIVGIQNTGQEIDYVEDMTIDGEDFSPAANLFVWGTRGMMQLLAGILAPVAMLILSLLLLVPWRLIAIRKTSDIAKNEADIARAILFLFMTATPVTSLILTQFEYIVFILPLVFIPSLFLLILGVLPLKKAYERKKAEKGPEGFDQ